MMATHMQARGRRARLHNLVLNPSWRFLRGFVLRGGFRDGWRGFLFACMEADYVREKFARLWLLQHSPGGGTVAEDGRRQNDGLTGAGPRPHNAASDPSRTP
jgi:hypothetical protein